MKPLLMSAPTLTHHPRNNHDSAADALTDPRTNDDRDDRADRAQETYARPQLTLASAPVWNHKLILTGRLDYRTAVELEDELECLCEEGVTVLTLDLRQLDAIDAVGAKAIACGGAMYKQRGRGFGVVPGSPVVHRALAEAGTDGLLAGDRVETGALGLARNVTESSPGETLTAMVKNL